MRAHLASSRLLESPNPPLDLKKLLFFLALPVIFILYSRNVTAQDRLDSVLDNLSKCESGGRESIKVLDSNGRFSYGRYQFQEETFVKYVKKYNLAPHAEDAEIMNFVFDGDFQRDLARRMIEDGGIGNWHNCARLLSLY